MFSCMLSAINYETFSQLLINFQASSTFESNKNKNYYCLLNFHASFIFQRECKKLFDQNFALNDSFEQVKGTPHIHPNGDDLWN